MKAGIKQGIIFGLIGGIAYIVLLTIRYNWSGANYFFYALFQAFSLVCILLTAALSAYFFRKQLGGFATLKQMFQPIFVTILISELFFCLYYYVYMNYIDPGYFDRYIPYVNNWMKINQVKPERVKETMDGLNAQKASKSDIRPLFAVLINSLILDGIFGLIIALIFRKRSVSEIYERAQERIQRQQNRPEIKQNN